MKTTPRFIQIHTLHSYPAALLNRDDSGLAKRLRFGDVTRTRISSQCLKRHWRKHDSEQSLQASEHFVESYRSRDTISQLVIKPLVQAHGELSEKAEKQLLDGFNKAVYGDKGDDRSKRQPLLLGQPEIDFLRDEASKILENGSDEKAIKAAVAEFSKAMKENLKTLRENTKLPGGLTSALFGRMVTSDTAANIDASIHVAHSFTVHGEESESDYFSVLDDLSGDEPGADHIGDSELTSGLYYGYAVVDVPSLVSNLEGIDRSEWASGITDRSMAADVVKRLLHTICTITPGAKLGATAPYSRASLALVEASDSQPRSLADSFRTPALSQVECSINKLCNHLQQLDDVYECTEARRHFALVEGNIPGSKPGKLSELQEWIGKTIEQAELIE